MKALRNSFFGYALAAGLGLSLFFIAPLKAKAAELIMLEQDGCYWCEIWNEEIGIAYPKTEEGKQAPLRRLDIHAELPPDLKALKKANYTPTFVLWHDGREVDRLRGYPGSHFFWPMLQQMLSKLDNQAADDATESKS